MVGEGVFRVVSLNRRKRVHEEHTFYGVVVYEAGFLYLLFVSVFVLDGFPVFVIFAVVVLEEIAHFNPVAVLRFLLTYVRLVKLSHKRYDYVFKSFGNGKQKVV